MGRNNEPIYEMPWKFWTCKFSTITPPRCLLAGSPVIKWSTEFPQLPNPLQETYSVKVMELQGAANFRVCLAPRGSSVSQIMESGNLSAGRVLWDCPVQAPHFPDDERAWPAKTTLPVGGERGLGFVARSWVGRPPPLRVGCPSLFRNSGKLSWSSFPSLGGRLCVQANDLVRTTQALGPMNASLSTEKFVVSSAGRPVGSSGEWGGDGEG